MKEIGFTMKGRVQVQRIGFLLSMLSGIILISSVAMAQAEGSSSSGAVMSGPVQSMNPDLSLDGLFDFSQFDRSNPVSWKGGHDPKDNGFTTQQVELTFGAPVDPYFRADANLVLVPENGEVHIEIEEAYATSLGLPYNLQLKAGAFFSAFGRNNPVHPHAWDFVNKPLVLGRMFGGDGLRNPGAQVSWLTPLPWFSELSLSGQNSTGDTAASFLSDKKMRDASDVLLLGRWSNFFDVSDKTALNLGTSVAAGPNGESPSHYGTRIFGADAYLKYRIPSSMSYIGLQAEAVKRYYGVVGKTLSDWGWYTQLTYRLPEPRHRWVIGLRYDWISDKQVGEPNTSNGEIDPVTTIAADTDMVSRYRVSPNVTFFASEFSKVRLQYDFDKSSILTQQAVHLQFEFIIGAHGAHKF